MRLGPSGSQATGRARAQGSTPQRQPPTHLRSIYGINNVHTLVTWFCTVDCPFCGDCVGGSSTNNTQQPTTTNNSNTQQPTTTNNSNQHQPTPPNTNTNTNQHQHRHQQQPTTATNNNQQRQPTPANTNQHQHQQQPTPTPTPSSIANVTFC